MSVPITPLANYVVAEAEAVSNKTQSGLYIPDSAAEKPKIAKVGSGQRSRANKVG